MTTATEVLQALRQLQAEMEAKRVTLTHRRVVDELVARMPTIIKELS